ncbi:hypothetical protein AMS68_007462 [Peltaster fructicola]|uniref:NAD(P)-binding domain-containing protein n=1 Tax=Peltaster fructicola TaxID=286661 RepID=A0A6H0Y4V8_9PEZI|nr:hypothetical protein AMS68_007462 [Peltaster fructicola]
MTTACVVGSTGLVGANILSSLLDSSVFSKVHAYTRRDLQSNAKLDAIRSSDTSTWAASYPKDADIFYSGLGTTRALAGGFENQRKIDFDFNLELAKAAKAAGTKVYVLISSASSNSKSVFGYVKMKGELEEEVIKLDFEHTIIVRPGLLIGQRTDSRAAESVFRNIAKAMNSINGYLQDFWAQEVQVVGRAAVAASLRVLAGNETRKVWYVEQSEIIKLGRTQWKS